MGISKFLSYLILSFCMLNLQLSPTFFELSTVYAQQSGDSTSANGTVTSSQSAGAEQAMSNVSSGVRTESFKGEDAGSMGSFMNILIMLIIGFSTMGLIYACSGFTADTIAAAIGGGIYIMSELMELFNSKEEASNRELPYTINKYGAVEDETQRTALMEERKAYQSVKESAENKAKYQKAAAAAFTAAAVIAIGVHMMGTTAAAACIAASKAEGLSGNVACAGAQGTAEAVTAFLNNPAPIEPSAVEKTKIEATALPTKGCGSCAPMNIWVLKEVQACIPVKPVYNDPNIPFTPMLESQMIALQDQAQDSLIEKFMDLFISKANASFTELLGGLGGGLLIAWMMKAKMDIAIDLFLGVPLKRGIVFGVLAMMAFTAASTSEEIAAKMQKNIDVIDSILNRYNRFADKTSPVGMPSRPAVSPHGNGFPSTRSLTKPKQIGTKENTFPCLAKTKSGQCASTAKLLDNKLAQTGVNFDPLTTQALGAAGQIADGASGQAILSPATDSLVGNLAGNQGALGKRLKKMEDLLNKNLKNSGRKGIDFDGHRNKIARGLRARVARSLKDQGKTAKGIVSSMYPVIADAPFANENTDDLIKEGTGESALGNQNGGVQASAGTIPSADLNFGMDDNYALPGAGTNDGEELDSNIEDMDSEVANQDIIQDNGVSIFKVISSRYRKSYDKLFEREGESEEKNVLDSDEKGDQ